MKKNFKYILRCVLAGVAIVAITPAAHAQHGHSGGGFHTDAPFIGGHRGGAGYVAGRGYHSGAFFRPGVGYYGYPHLGFYLKALPFGYYPFYWNTALFYYYDGIFYSPFNGGGFVVTVPPIGVAVPDLPDNADAIKIDGVQYYEQDGVYYKESVDDKGKTIYVVVGRDGVLNTNGSVVNPNTPSAPQQGDLVNQLPDGCRKVILNGHNYFVSPSGIYYEKTMDDQGNTAYKIVSIPEPGA